MRLKFLGKGYEATPNNIEGAETDETVKFLGRRYQMKQFDVAQRRHQSGEELRFLGRKYQR